MKKMTLTLVAILALFCFCQNVYAQTITSSNFNDNGHTVAAGEIVWFGTTLADAVNKSQDGYVYLYNVKTGKFLNAGGAYGVHAVLSSVGMRVKVAQTTYNGRTVYTIQGRIDNPAQGDYMSPNGNGNDIYMDRKEVYTTGDQYSRPNWLFTQSNQQVTVNGTVETFTNLLIYNNDRNDPRYAGTNGTNSNDVYFVNSSGYNNIWRFVSEEDYQAAMDGVTWGSVDLGSFLKDAEFGRDNKDGRYWVWSLPEEPTVPTSIGTATDSEGSYTADGWNLTSGNVHWHQRNQDKMCNGHDFEQSGGISGNTIGTINGNTVGNTDWDGFRNSYAKYYAAEIYNEKIILSQQLSMTGVENLKEGLYKMTAQALYYDDVNGLTNTLSSNSERANAYFFVETQSDVDGETVTHYQELPIIAMNKVSNRISPHSGVSAGSVFDNNPKAYLLEFYVELKGDTKITLGMRTEEAKGWTVIGNIHMYAHGKQALFLNEDWTDNETIEYLVDYSDGTQSTESFAGNPYTFTMFNQSYDFPATVYYTRTMNVGKWTTICLPFALTGAQVRSAFGGDCQLSEYDGLNASGRVMKFKKIDLDVDGMESCTPYIIKPSRKPDLAKDETMRLEVGNGGLTHHVDVVGPVYFIAGVTREESSSSLPVSKNVEKSGITFTGNFYAMTIKKENVNSASHSGTADYWVLSSGEMYHLQGTKDWNIWGTYAYLTAPASSGAKDFTFMIEDTGEVITSIDGLELRESNTFAEDAKVYSISGQLANKNSLTKGIYIVNGRKYVVK